MWNSARDLQIYLQNESKKNAYSIPINSTAMKSGQYYTLVVLVSNDGNRVETKQFPFGCSGNSTKAGEGGENLKQTQQTPNNWPVESTTISRLPTTSTTPITEKVVSERDNRQGQDKPNLYQKLEEMSSTYPTTISLASTTQMGPISIELLASDVTFRDLGYSIKAQVSNSMSMCSYRWKIRDNFERPIPNLRTDTIKGSEFSIDSSTLRPGTNYSVSCTLIDSTTEQVLDEADKTFLVLRRDLVANIGVRTLVVGVKRPFKLNAYLNVRDYRDYPINMEWNCRAERSKGACENSALTNSSSLEMSGLDVLDTYTFSLALTASSTTRRAFCRVLVVEAAFVRLDVEAVKDLVDPSREIEIFAYISQLKTGCQLKWSVVTQGKPYDFQVGNLNRVFNVTLRDDEFLNEIDEFSNATLDAEYNLDLPFPNERWKGLEKNASYLFRLNATCPIQRQEEQDYDAEPLMIERYVSVYADILINTGTLPELKNLYVHPQEGTALRTLFTFSVVDETDPNVERPTTYKFGYKIDGGTIFLDVLTEISNTTATLPYLKNGIQTVVIACNGHSFCSQLLGSVVNVQPPTYTDEYTKTLKDELKGLLHLEEFYKYFTLSLAILKTCNETNGPSDEMSNYISNLTSVEIKRLLMLSADGGNEWEDAATNLLKNVGFLLNSFPIPQFLLNNVAALRNELSRAKDGKGVTIKKRSIETDRRRVIKSVTAEEMEAYLRISELIIGDKTDPVKVEQEKRNFLSQIDTQMRGMCVSLHENSKSSFNLATKSTILSVEKLTATSLLKKYHHVLNAKNAWKLDGRIKLDECFTRVPRSESEHLCLGKLATRLYFEENLTFFAKIYSDDYSIQSTCPYTLIFPILDEFKVQNSKVKLRCAVWSERRWDFSLCESLSGSSKSAQCSCNSLGFYTVDYQVLTSTIATKTVSDSTQTSATPKFDAETQVPWQNYPNLTQVEFISPNATVDGGEGADHLGLKEDATIPYLVIGISLFAMAVTLCGIKRLLSEYEETKVQNMDAFPKYATLHDQHTLHDVPTI